MKRLKLALVLMLIAVITASCAPPQAMVATLTMLPGTPTPRRPTPYRTSTGVPTPTKSSEGFRYEATVYVPANCPAGSFTSSPPEDASRMVGLSYNPDKLPSAFDLQGQGLLDNGEHRWVWVRWQGRSLYWIDALMCRSLGGDPYWEVVDALALPRLNLSANEAETNLCFYGQRQIQNAIAYGIFDPAAPVEMLPNGKQARPLNLQAAWQMRQSFEPLNPRDLRCYVEEKP